LQTMATTKTPKKHRKTKASRFVRGSHKIRICGLKPWKDIARQKYKIEKSGVLWRWKVGEKQTHIHELNEEKVPRVNHNRRSITKNEGGKKGIFLYGKEQIGKATNRL